MVKPILWLLAVWFLLGWAFTLELDRQTIASQGRTPAPIIDGPKVLRHHKQALTPQPLPPTMQEAEEALLVIGLLGAGLSAFILWRILRAIQFNISVYPQQLRNWQLSFMCRGCGAVFFSPDANTIKPLR